jgi:hypothetical protein
MEYIVSFRLKILNNMYSPSLSSKFLKSKGAQIRLCKEKKDTLRLFLDKIKQICKKK